MSEEPLLYGDKDFIEAMDAFCQANEPAPSQQESSISMTMPEIVDVVNSFFGDTHYSGVEVSAELKKRGYLKILSVQDLQFRVLIK